MRLYRIVVIEKRIKVLPSNEHSAKNRLLICFSLFLKV